MEGHVKSTIAKGVATITFFHPQRNSLPLHLLDRLTEEITKAGNDSNAKVIVLQSEGNEVFCAGGSFDEMLALKEVTTGKIFFSGFANVINAIRKAPKFVIARVQGKVVGGGMGIACAADYTVGIESSSVKLSELAIGIGPIVIGPAVIKKIGLSAYTTLTLNGAEWKSAQWAMNKGLYADVYKSIEEMDLALNTLTQNLSASNPDSMKLIKKDLWTGTDDWDILLVQKAEAVSKLVLSDYAINALTKFKNKQ